MRICLLFPGTLLILVPIVRFNFFSIFCRWSRCIFITFIWWQTQSQYRKFCCIKSSRVHRLIKSNFVVESVFWWLQGTKKGGWQILGDLEWLCWRQQIFGSAKRESQKKSNPTIPFNRGWKTKQKSKKHLKILGFEIYTLESCIKSGPRFYRPDIKSVIY